MINAVIPAAPTFAVASPLIRTHLEKGRPHLQHLTVSFFPLYFSLLSLPLSISRSFSSSVLKR